MIRKIRRNIMKNEIGSNKIRYLWRQMQLKLHKENKGYQIFNKRNPVY